MHAEVSLARAATCARPARKNDQGLVVRSTLWDTIRSHVMKNADTGARK
jgi:hypothetical protein